MNMRRLITMLGVALGMCSLPLSAAEKGFVYTANEQGRSISVINISTGQVKTIPILISPHNVQISHDGRLLLAVGSLSDMTDDPKVAKDNKRGRLMIIDANTLAIE